MNQYAPGCSAQPCNNRTNDPSGLCFWHRSEERAQAAARKGSLDGRQSLSLTPTPASSMCTASFTTRGADPTFVQCELPAHPADVPHQTTDPFGGNDEHVMEWTGSGNSYHVVQDRPSRPRVSAHRSSAETGLPISRRPLPIPLTIPSGATVLWFALTEKGNDLNLPEGTITARSWNHRYTMESIQQPGDPERWFIQVTSPEHEWQEDQFIEAPDYDAAVAAIQRHTEMVLSWPSREGSIKSALQQIEDGLPAPDTTPPMPYNHTAGMGFGL